MRVDSDSRKTRVVIVEDHPMFREQLALLINKEEEMLVCGEADNVADAFSIIGQVEPDIAIVDITLKGSSGLELLKDLRAHEIDLPVLVLSMHDESLYAERALRAGAKGYITKNEASAKVMVALRAVMDGQLYLDPRFMSRIVTRMVGNGRSEDTQPIDRLTDRELEVFELIGRGQTTRQIGTQLNLGLTTVDTYRARIKEKLHLENAATLQTEAARWVQQREALIS